MDVLRLTAVRSYAVIGVAAIVLATGLLASQPVSAATSSTASADLVTTITPTSQEQTEYVGSPCCYFRFTAVVTNNGPDPASNVVLSVSGVTTPWPQFSGTIVFSVSPAENCSRSGLTFSCSTLPDGASVTAVVAIHRFCVGEVCSGAVTATTASSGTADPNTATGGWEIVCWGMRNCYP
jgi:Domain of unknown function DUF11